MNLSDKQRKKLTHIIEASQNGGDTSYAMYTEKAVKVLVDAELAECNTVITGEGNTVAVRVTQTGLNYMNTETSNGNPAFVIDDNVSRPARRRVGKTSIYPFNDLAVGQSFFVPATEEMPDPAKSLASTVSGASRRFATPNGTRTINRRPLLTDANDTPVMGEDGKQARGELTPTEVTAYTYERKFVVSSVDENGTKGARIWRVAVEAQETE